MKNKFKYVANEEIKKSNRKLLEAKDEGVELLRKFYSDATGKHHFAFSKNALPSTDYVDFLEDLIEGFLQHSTKSDEDILKAAIKKHTI